MKDNDKCKDGAEGKEKKGNNDHKNNDGGYVSIVLTASLHCKRCATKVIRSMKRLDDVVEVMVDESNMKLHVTGKAGMDPSILITKLEALTRKKATLLSFDTDESKIEEPEDGGRRAHAMVVLKIGLHCKGCMTKVKERILRVEGVEWVGMDLERNVVVVKGTMGVEGMVVYFEEELRRKVEIVAIMGEEEGGDGDGEEGKKEEPKREDVGEEKTVSAEKVNEDRGEEKVRKERVQEEAKKRKDAMRQGKKVEVLVGGDCVAREHKGWGQEVGRDRDFGSIYNAHLPYMYHTGMRCMPRTFSEENPNACILM